MLIAPPSIGAKTRDRIFQSSGQRHSRAGGDQSVGRELEEPPRLKVRQVVTFIIDNDEWAPRSADRSAFCQQIPERFAGEIKLSLKYLAIPAGLVLHRELTDRSNEQ